MNTRTATYSLAEFFDALDAPPANVANVEYRDTYRQRDAHGWCGIERDAAAGETTHAAIRRLVREGWPRGVKLMTQVLSSVEVPAPVSVRRRASWCDAGDDLELQRVWSGDLEHAWRRTARRAGVGPARVRLLVDSIAGGGEKASVMRWRGVAALVAADALTAAGYTVQVESVYVGSINGERFTPRVIVKDYMQPLDLPTLAATTACPGFFRQLGHELVWTLSPLEHACPGMRVYDAIAERFLDDGDAAPVFVAGQRITNASEAAAWVAETIRALDGSTAAAA